MPCLSYRFLSKQAEHNRGGPAEASAAWEPPRQDGVQRHVARRVAAPFALPWPGASVPRSPLLGAPQFAVLLMTLVLVPIAIVLLAHPALPDALDRRAALRYRDTFGYALGDLPTRQGVTYWGVTAVTPGGRAERAGLRAGDVFVGRSASLLWAVAESAAGRRACVEVWNLDTRPREVIRSVCFSGGR